MKIYNWTLLGLALLLAVPGIPASFRHKDLSELVILLWLVSIPTISLLSLFYGERNHKEISLAFGGVYNTISAAVFFVYAVSLNITNSHPVAFAIMDQVFAFLLALSVGINALLIYGSFKRNKASNKSTQEGQPPSSAAP